MSGLFNVGHIAQLHEIQSARLRRGLPGIGPEIEEMIRRLRDGGSRALLSDNPRVAQAKRLYDKGFCWGTDIDTFDAYLDTIPEIPEELKEDRERFPLLTLVDGRPGIVKTCEILRVRYGCAEGRFQRRYGMIERAEVYWMRAQAGLKNKGKLPQTCREEFAVDETGLVVIEGLAILAQYRDTLRDMIPCDGGVRWALDLCDSMGCTDSLITPYIFWDNDRPVLDGGSEHARPHHGSGSRRK